LFKGSVVYNVPDSIAALEAKYPQGQSWSMYGFKMMGLLISPEVVSEIGKGQGAAVALLGLNLGGKSGPEAEWVAIVQPGTSNAPPFLMRTIMSMVPLKVKETVERVKLSRS